MKDFTEYKEALELKELGFDEPCFAYYLAGGIRFKEYKDSQNKNSAFYNNTVCSIPLYQQAFRWFRKNYNAVVVIQPHIVGDYAKILISNKVVYDTIQPYEEVELTCLKELIKIVKNGK